MSRWFPVVVLLAGCNGLLGLETPSLIDAAATSDQDGDGIIDLEDNCVAVANADQRDEDQDTIGNACDNCPVVPNPGQEHEGDADPVGDQCDPHPIDPGDCLVLVDTFDDPSRFAEHWLVHATAGETPTVNPAPGHVIVGSKLGTNLEVQADLAGVYDVIVVASARLETTENIQALTNTSADFDGYGCGALGGSPPSTIISSDTPGGHGFGTGGMSSVAIASNLMARLSLTKQPVATFLACRIDYGVALGLVSTVIQLEDPLTGRPGILVQAANAELDAIQVSSYDPQATTCAPTELR